MKISKPGKHKTRYPVSAPTDSTETLATPDPALPIREKPQQPPASVLDGRSLQATGRTAQLNFRVRHDTKEKLYSIAKRTGRMFVEVLEEALDLYEKKLDGR
ncbi:MAG: hypothetical protein AB1646_23320 [Thermodesulfobacteriota bacterium]